MADSITPKCSNGWCEVPGGTFEMGSKDGYADEQPVKTVRMTGFELGQTEVSVGEYKKYLGDKLDEKFKSILLGRNNSDTTQATIVDQMAQNMACISLNLILSLIYTVRIRPLLISYALPDFEENKKGHEYPVVALTFDKELAYCQAKGGTLPTAAQLHYASRNDRNLKYKDQMVLRDNQTDSYRGPMPVTTGYQNAYGIYNLLGNVWESTLDAYDEFFYKRMPSQDPYNPLTNPQTKDLDDRKKQWQELSGEDYNSSYFAISAASRGATIPTQHVQNEGFRCARPLPQDVKEKN